jgi:hypothetical protein
MTRSTLNPRKCLNQAVVAKVETCLLARLAVPPWASERHLNASTPSFARLPRGRQRGGYNSEAKEITEANEGNKLSVFT